MPTKLTTTRDLATDAHRAPLLVDEGESDADSGARVEVELTETELTQREIDGVVVLSYGGGLNSWVMLTEAVRRGEHIDYVVFADVGDATDRTVPGEWPSTYDHINEVVKPFCAAHGLYFIAIDHTTYPVRATAADEAGFASLHDYAMSKKIFWACSQHVCTIAAKIERIEAWADDNFADQLVTMWIGFDAGEESRAKNDPRGPEKSKLLKDESGKARRRSRWPLMEWGYCRCYQERIAAETGLPVPRKSACVGCPKSSRGDLLQLKREAPALFAEIEKYEANGKLTRSGHRLKFAGTDRKETMERGEIDVPAIGDWVEGRKPNGAQMKLYKRVIKACPTCGAAQRATKATGCTFLQADEMVPGTELPASYSLDK